MLAAEIQHLLRLRNAADHRAGKLTARRNNTECGQRQRLFRLKLLGFRRPRCGRNVSRAFSFRDFNLVGFQGFRLIAILGTRRQWWGWWVRLKLARSGISRLTAGCPGIISPIATHLARRHQHDRDCGQNHFHQSNRWPPRPRSPPNYGSWSTI